MDFLLIDYIVYGLQLLMDFQFMDFQFIDYIVYRLQLLMDFQFMDFQLIEFQFMEYCWRNSFLDIVHVDSINCIGLSRLRIDLSFIFWIKSCDSGDNELLVEFIATQIATFGADDSWCNLAWTAVHGKRRGQSNIARQVIWS